GDAAGPAFFFSSRRRHTRFSRDWSSDVCSSDLPELAHVVAELVQDLLGPDAAGQLAVPADQPVQVLAVALETLRADAMDVDQLRSEERRVGKECRSRRSR